MAEIDEAALVERALRGDHQAFATLIDAYGRVVYNLALRMVNDVEDAQDLAQTVFIKAWEKLATFDRRNRFFSWLYRIALNESLNYRARRRRHEVLDEGLRSTEPGPDERFAATQEIQMVQAALMELREDDREVVVLRHFLQLSHHEMSAILGVPEKTVKSRLYSARQRLEVQLRRKGLSNP
jgi:RNA polymerase sigma-70 factor (ECF subfamily)